VKNAVPNKSQVGKWNGQAGLGALKSPSSPLSFFEVGRARLSKREIKLKKLNQIRKHLTLAATQLLTYSL
jgi:hypothetical protein